MSVNILFCSVGRRGRLLNNFRKLLNERGGRLIATDNSQTAPALYFSHTPYVVAKITDAEYLTQILEICRKEDVKAITTLIDPEINILAKNRELFIESGVLPLCPSLKTAELCYDKYAMFEYVHEKGINTVLTYSSLESFEKGLKNNKIAFPVFVKPRTGSGSVGAQKVDSFESLREILSQVSEDFIIQELMVGDDIDVDVYVDCISNKPVSIFSKRKLETKIGGANKTISFKCPQLIEIVKSVVDIFEFYGPIDMDFFCKEGKYYLSEINPRFGGAYLHAFGAGVNFLDLINKNINGEENEVSFNQYDDNVLMLMYDDVVIKHESDLAK